MKRVNKISILIISVLLVALSIRLWGINFGLPYIYHPDEPRYIESAQVLFKTHDLNPNTLPNISSSSFVYVVNALAYIPYYLLGKLVGVFDSPVNIPAPTMLTMGVGYISMPTAFLIGRIVTTLFGTASVALTFLIGHQWLKSSVIGLLASFMLATSLTNVIHSRFVTPDTFVVFFVLTVFLGATYIYKQNGTIPYILSGVAFGFMVSTKISGVFILLPVLIAHFHSKKVKGLLDPNLYLMFVVSGFSFVVSTPYIIGDFGDVIRDILFEGRHYSTGHAGMEGNSLVWYLNYMWKTAGVIYIIAIVEILRGIYSRSKEIILLSVFPIIYFVFISGFVVRNDRTFLPVTPFAFLLAASFLSYSWDKVNRLESEVLRKLSIAAIACLSVIGLILPISKTITETVQLTTIDSRETARVWISNNLPPGTKIAIESYSPFVEPEHFFVQGVGRIIDYEPDWYLENGFDYLIFSQGIYGRFYREPEKYGVEISKYDSFFNSLLLTKMFTDGDYEIRIYATK